MTDTRVKTVTTTVTYRFAEFSDTRDIEELDRICFIDASSPGQPAAADEIGLGVLLRRVIVAVQHDEPSSIIGFAQYHIEASSKTAYIAGIGVRHDFRRHGIGSELLRECRSAIEEDRTRVHQMTMSIAPNNVAMMAVACESGFVGTHYVADYFGADGSRIIFSSSGLHTQLQSTETLFVPAGSENVLRHKLDGASWQLAGVRRFPHGYMLELQRFSANERASMMANEASVSVSFASVIIAALAVLVGFGFNENEGFPPALIAQMILAIIVTLIGLLIYANSTGQLSRLDFACVNRYMQMGNIVTEFGGVYPMLHVLPVSVAVLTEDAGVGFTSALAASIASWAYQRSEFGILKRYKRNSNALSLKDAPLVLSPMLGYLSWARGVHLSWVIYECVLLLWLGWWCMRRIPQVAALGTRTNRTEAT